MMNFNIKRLAITIIATVIFLGQILPCVANEKEIVKLDLHLLPLESAVRPESFSDFPLILPSSVVADEGNQARVTNSQTYGRGAQSERAILLEKVIGSGRVSVAFGWPAHSFPNGGIFETKLDLQFLKVEGESGNLMISLFSESKAIAVLQVAKSGSATLIAIQEEGPAITEDVGKLPINVPIDNLVLRLNYDSGKLSFLLNGEPKGPEVEFNRRLTPNILAISSSTDRSSTRSIAIFNIAAVHRLDSK